MNRLSKPLRWLLPLGVILVALLGWLSYRWSNGSGSRVDIVALQRDTSTALAHLENLSTDAADPLWVSLASRVPSEILPVRNLAITRLLALSIEEENDLKPVTEAFETLLEREQSAPAFWLQAQLILHPGVTDPSVERDLRAQELLKQAAALAPNEAHYWFEIYQVGVVSQFDEVQVAGLEALAKAWELAPDNIHVLSNWLVAQAQASDPRIESTLQRARDTLGPLESVVNRVDRISIKEYLDKAEQAVSEQNWTEAVALLRILRNVIPKTEIAKQDLSRMAPHPLDFVLTKYREYDLRATDSATDPPSAAASYTLSERAFPETLRQCRALSPADFNLDGKVDLVALLDDKLLVLEQADDAWQASMEIEVPAGMRGMLLGDLDRDLAGGKRKTADSSEEVLNAARVGAGAPRNPDKPTGACHEADLDLVLYGDGGVLVFRNESPPGKQPSVALVAQSSEFAKLSGVTAASLVDVDHDGDLDLVIAAAEGLRIWSSTGAGLQFEDISHWSKLPGGPDGPPSQATLVRPGGPDVIQSLAIADWDRDVDVDILVSGDDGRTWGMLENIRHARFVWRTFEQLELPAAEQGGSRALQVVEHDGNVSWDLASAGATGVTIQLTQTNLAGAMSALSTVRVTADPVAGATVGDLNNDTYLDAVSWSGAELVVHYGTSDPGKFSSSPPLVMSAAIIVCALGDVDRDGDLDLLIATEQGVQEFRCEAPKDNNWLTVQAMGRDDNKGRCNETGIGSMIEVMAGDRYLARMVTGQETHFGLGRYEKPQVLRTIWTNGVPQAVVEPHTRLSLCEPMILKGSCPYVYTWTGEQFEFFTDCLWAAPIGLQLAEGVSAPFRPWEYLRIPGDRLRERDGQYQIQLTEELWEAGYFDHVELIAVDHPEHVDVYSNEKVGPEQIAAFKIHTVTDPRQPVSAQDQRGRDVMAKLAARDEEYLKAFDTQTRQGLTEEHYIELDLGKLDSPKQITLFLTGWIYPSDTSLNLAFSQAPELSGPRPPAVWTPDAQGVWREVSAYMGFPGGKTKTIAVDLSTAFAANDYRVRIVTTAEIYWDHAFFTVDEPTVELQTERLQPQSAHLHYRGFSRRRPGRANAPEQYDYRDVRTEPVWPPMRGSFTRYGDVLPLLVEADDLQAVLGAGDEMTVSFLAPAPPPAGWRRDFLLHCVGWDKDADLNTFHGQSVEPLPFRAMSR
ncbi:MAG: VCBS repeat-containing protein, partial [Planctomycetales bacterium]|nr:VCBS repeat-containing protein [Planctomycetales bacterium]